MPNGPIERRKRTLSDEDIVAVAEAFKEQFFQSLGRGLWGLVQRAFVYALVSIAAAGAYSELHDLHK